MDCGLFSFHLRLCCSIRSWGSRAFGAATETRRGQSSFDKMVFGWCTRWCQRKCSRGNLLKWQQFSNFEHRLWRYCGPIGFSIFSEHFSGAGVELWDLWIKWKVLVVIPKGSLFGRAGPGSFRNMRYQLSMCYIFVSFLFFSRIEKTLFHTCTKNNLKNKLKQEVST